MSQLLLARGRKVTVHCYYIVVLVCFTGCQRRSKEMALPLNGIEKSTLQMWNVKEFSKNLKLCKLDKCFQSLNPSPET